MVDTEVFAHGGASERPERHVRFCQRDDAGMRHPLLIPPEKHEAKNLGSGAETPAGGCLYCLVAILPLL